MTRSELAAALARQPRISLAALPTALQEAPRLRDALGGPTRCPRILIKRDDLTGLGLGGNKARKLEFLVADAQRKGATTLITTGAAQSNHARMTAAAARIAGMQCELVLTAYDAAPADEGNLLLDRLFGARVHFIPVTDPMVGASLDEAQMQAVAQDVRARGGVPYVIPVGGSSPVGALGYVAGTAELCDQLAAIGAEPTRLYFASGSRGTQAGLTLGAQLCGASYRLFGVAVSGGDPEKTERARGIARDAAALLGADAPIGALEFHTEQQHIGEGYGIATAQCLEALILVARSEALVLDVSYTAKAMAGLVHDVRAGLIGPDETVVFLHTGGSPAVFTRASMAALTSAPQWT